jgi:hypothetical protein
MKCAANNECDPIKPGVEALVEEHETYDKTYTVIAPLVGIRVGPVPLEIGGVTFRHYDSAVNDQFIARCKAIIDAKTQMTDEAKDNHFATLKKSYLSAVRTNSCAEFDVSAEPKRAREIAMAKIRQAVDLLRYATMLLHDRSEYRAIGLFGEASEESRVTIAIRTDDTAFSVSDETVNYGLSLSENVRERMKKVYVFDLAAIANNENRNEFESMLLRVVRWIASAQSQVDNGNVLTSLMSSLETVFKVEQNTPITNTITSGVALLTKEDVAQRQVRKDRMNYFYGLRSRVSHGHETGMSDDDIQELTGIVFDVTKLIIENRSKFDTPAMFVAWLNEQKLTAKVEFR